MSRGLAEELALERAAINDLKRDYCQAWTERRYEDAYRAHRLFHEALRHIAELEQKSSRPPETAPAGQ